MSDLSLPPHSLFTEILPGARATMMSGVVAATSLGRVTGTLVGGPVWLAGGLTATGIVAAAITGLALVCLAWGLRGWRTTESHLKGGHRSYEKPTE